MRLPRDWLGPREELVPIGRPAAPGAAAPFGDDGLPPTAEDFWGEDSAALHSVVQGPTTGTASASADVTTARRLGWLSHPRAWWPRRLVVPARWLVLAVPVVALLVLAAIGATEQPSVRHPGHALASNQSQLAAEVGLLGTQSATQTWELAHAELTARRRQHQPSRSPARTPAHHARTRPARHSHTRTRVTRSTATSSRPKTVSPSPADTSAQSSPTSPPTVPASPTSAGSTSQHVARSATSTGQTPFGQNGSLGPGSSPDS